MLERVADELTFENTQVLYLVQAMIGDISPNIRAVSLECVARAVRLHFLLAQEQATDRESIDDIVFEFEALQERGIEVNLSVVVSSRQEASAELPGRRVFGRREVHPAPPDRCRDEPPNVAVGGTGKHFWKKFRVSSSFRRWLSVGRER